MKPARPLLVALLSCVASPVFAEAPATDAPSRVHLAPKGYEAAYHDYHYSPAVRVGDMVIVSGIPAAVGETYEDKVRWMFRQLQAQLEVAGASMSDVVELTSFHAGATDTKTFNEEFARLAPIHHEFFSANYPAWSAVGTTALLQHGAPVELRAVAIIGSGRNPKVDIPRPAPRQTGSGA